MFYLIQMYSRDIRYRILLFNYTDTETDSKFTYPTNTAIVNTTDINSGISITNHAAVLLPPKQMK